MSSSVRTAKNHPATDETAGGGTVVGRSSLRGSPRDKIKFGDVIITVRKPSKSELKQNVDFSSEALARANTRLAHAGIRIHPKKDVPLFFADPENPGGFIRKLNGKLQRGVVRDGQFTAID
jgi:hypothetical protein